MGNQRHTASDKVSQMVIYIQYYHKLTSVIIKREGTLLCTGNISGKILKPPDLI